MSTGSWGERSGRPTPARLGHKILKADFTPPSYRSIVRAQRRRPARERVTPEHAHIRRPAHLARGPDASPARRRALRVLVSLELGGNGLAAAGAVSRLAAAPTGPVLARARSEKTRVCFL